MKEASVAVMHEAKRRQRYPKPRVVKFDLYPPPFKFPTLESLRFLL